MASEFQPFNPRGEVTKTRRHLPHWAQPGATYFVTFRLADSLPREVLDRYAEMRRLNDDDAFAWLDKEMNKGSGLCCLADPERAAIVASTLRHFDGTRYALGVFVVMPNHVHVLVQPKAGNDLATVVRSWKSYSAHQLQRRAGLEGAVWQSESFDRIVRDEAELERFNEYIAKNPGASNLRPGTFLLGCGSAACGDVTK